MESPRLCHCFHFPPMLFGYSGFRNLPRRNAARGPQARCARTVPAAVLPRPILIGANLLPPLFFVVTRPTTCSQPRRAAVRRSGREVEGRARYVFRVLEFQRDPFDKALHDIFAQNCEAPLRLRLSEKSRLAI